MKIIDLLNKIANGEKPPRKILFKEQEYEYDIGERDYYYCNGAIYWLFDEYVITGILNDEVEILEITITFNKQNEIAKAWLQQENERFLRQTFGNHNKIEKLEISGRFTRNQKKLANKINEIIDKVNEL